MSPTLTLFSTCKPFGGAFDVLQDNALESWARLGPDVEVLLLGDEPGVEERCRRLGFRHQPALPRSPKGVPLLDGLFDVAEQEARTPFLAFANADIVLAGDLGAALAEVSRGFERFLLVARRWNLDGDAPIDFDRTTWTDELENQARTRGRLEPVWGGIDLFVFPRGLFTNRLHPFVIGRGRWDSALLLEALRAGAALVDGTERILSVHPDHDYSHTGMGDVFQGPEARRNAELLGGPAYVFTCLNATHRLTARGLERHRIRNPIHGLRWAATLPAQVPWLAPLRPLVSALAPAWRFVGEARARWAA